MLLYWPDREQLGAITSFQTRIYKICRFSRRAEVFFHLNLFLRDMVRLSLSHCDIVTAMTWCHCHDMLPPYVCPLLHLVLYSLYPTLYYPGEALRHRFGPFIASTRKNVGYSDTTAKKADTMHKIQEYNVPFYAQQMVLLHDHFNDSSLRTTNDNLSSLSAPLFII